VNRDMLYSTRADACTFTAYDISMSPTHNAIVQSHVHMDAVVQGAQKHEGRHNISTAQHATNGPCGTLPDL
jgi:hypothetical protein